MEKKAGKVLESLKGQEQRQKRRKALAGILVFVVLSGLVCWFVGEPFLQLVSEPEQLRAWVKAGGPWAKLAFVGMMALQIVIAFIPGEPLEIGAGYAFGPIEGTVLCLLGALLGGTAVFLFVKRFGMKFATLFVSEQKLRTLKFLQDEKKLDLIAYLLFLIPGTPKDVMTYVVGLTPMKLSFWIFLTLTARIPSVITSTVGGDALGTQNYLAAVWVFAATAVISFLGLFVYRAIINSKGKQSGRVRQNGRDHVTSTEKDR